MAKTRQTVSVTFKKNHVVGIKKGHTAMVDIDHAKRLHKEGYVELDEASINEEDIPEFVQYKLKPKDFKPGSDFSEEQLEGKKVGDVVEVPNPDYI